MKLVSSKFGEDQTPFVAISHAQSDGLGNNRDNVNVFGVDPEPIVAAGIKESRIIGFWKLLRDRVFDT